MKRLSGGALVLGLLSALPAAAADREITARATVGDGQEVFIDFPVGEVEIVGVPGSELRLEVLARCKRSTLHCEDRLEEIEVEIRERPRGPRIEVAPHSKWRWWDSLEIDARFWHPADRPLIVDMGVGEIEVEGLESDLELDLGVGEASVDLDVRFVSSVLVDVGIGDSELLVPEGWVRGDRSFLIGSESSWRDGPGEARIRVDVGVGQAVVRLDD